MTKKRTPSKKANRGKENVQDHHDEEDTQISQNQADSRLAVDQTSHNNPPSSPQTSDFAQSKATATQTGLSLPQPNFKPLDPPKPWGSVLVPQPSSQRSAGARAEATSNAESDNNNNSSHHKENIEQFHRVCNTLQIDKETMKIAQRLFQATQTKYGLLDSENTMGWVACSLYIATVETQAVSLSSILFSCSIRANVFFQFLHLFLDSLSLDASYEQKRRLVEKKFVIGSILIRKFHQFYPEVLMIRNHHEHQDIFKFTWLLSLIVRDKLLQTMPELIRCFHVLLCCIDFTYSHVKEAFQIVPPSELTQGVPHILSHLCALSGASYQDVQQLYDLSFLPLIKSLSQYFHYLKDPSNPSQFPFKNLFSHGNLGKNIIVLQKDYQVSMLIQAELDEILFLNMPEIMKTPCKSPQRQWRTEAALGDSPVSFLSSPISQVPENLTNISWLKETLPKNKYPSEKFKQFIEDCTNPRETETKMKERIEMLTKALQNMQITDKDIFVHGMSLYYRILESMITTESQRLNQKNFSTLLNHETFQLSLLACSFEIILYTYKPKDKAFAFPVILELCGLAPYDFCKVIESVVRHEPALPKPLVRHMTAIEEKILETLAWKSTSPLLQVLRDPANLAVLKGVAGVSENPSQLLGSPALKKDAPPAVSLLASPKPLSNTSNNRNANSSNGPSSSGNTAPKSHSLELFARKLFRLAHLRTKDLCCRLAIKPVAFQQIWSTLVQVITDHSFLLVDRHLDQAMITSIYGVCRFLNLEHVTFKAIIDQYKQQPQAKSHNSIWRSVLLFDDSRGDIIQYYNTIFIPKMEPVILQLRNITGKPEFSHLPGSPKTHSVSTTHNIYLSPLKTAPNITPTRACVTYSREKSPSRTEINDINQNLRVRASTRIKLFENDDESDP